MKRLCVIPARGGSKRIPRKNIKPFLGQPIISYSINAAIESKLFDEVMVSTDDEEIANYSKSLGAKVPFLRSEQNSNDFATIADVIKEVIEYYGKNGEEFNQVACLFATAPFISSQKITEAINQLTNSTSNSVFFIQEFSYPILRSLKQNESNFLEMNWPENLNKRSQDLPKAFHDAGMFYVAETKAFLAENTFFTARATGILVSDIEARDIDNDADWRIAEVLFKLTK